MAAFGAKAITLTTTTGNKTTAGMACSVNDYIVVFTAKSGETTQTTVSDSNTDGLSAYTNIQNAGRGGTDEFEAWVRNSAIGVAESTTFTRTATSDTGGGLWVARITGMTTFGSAGVRQSGKQVDGAGGTTPAVALSVGACLTGNPVLGAVWCATNPPAATPPTSWTERDDAGYATPNRGLETATIDSGETGSTITWGSTVASTFSAIALELNATANVAMSVGHINIGF